MVPPYKETEYPGDIRSEPVVAVGLNTVSGKGRKSGNAILTYTKYDF
jgi:hypothetical protein